MTDAVKVRSALIAIHNANRDEIALGKLANDRAQSADVKQYATMMVHDHTAADKKLVDLAKREKIDLTVGTPQDPVRAAIGDASKELESSLSNLRGAQFDTAYIAPQAMMHDLVLHVIDGAEKANPKPEIKNFLTTAKKTVSEHHERALALQSRLTLGETPVGGGPAESPEQKAEPMHSGAMPAPPASGEHPKAPPEKTAPPEKSAPENQEAPGSH
jgi:putative membrane protein